LLLEALRATRKPRSIQGALFTTDAASSLI